MITDEERCEVARRLRDMRLKPWDDTACEIASCAGIVCCNSECHGSDETPECARALCDRLADLIEPNQDNIRTVSGNIGTVSGIDRDALLNLADECGDASGAYAGDGHELTSRQFANVARRIREALGVER